MSAMPESLLSEPELTDWLPGGRQDGTVADVAGAVSRYLVDRTRRRELKPKTTARNYRYTLASFVRSVGPDLSPSRITRRHIQRWMTEQANAPTTLRLKRSIVIGFLDWCVDEGLVRRNVARGLGKIKVPQPLARDVDPEGVTATLEEAPDARARVMVSLMVQEGLRAQEVAGVEVGDVDVRGRVLTVRHGKGDKERVVPLSDETAEAILSYLGESPARAGPLIRSYSHPNEPLTPQYVSSLVSSWMHQAGLVESGHALRHTCATDLLDGGMDIRLVQHWMGHEHLTTTERYTKGSVVDLRANMPDRRYRELPDDHQGRLL